jgi:selenocysteine lyase/cysteine desulfurase
MYDIAKNSEDLYYESKQKIADLINSSSTNEIIYTYNSTYAVNLLTQTLRFNNKLKA